MSIKYLGVGTFYGNHQRTPFFATPQEVSKWTQDNNIEIDCIMEISNWREVIEWQNNPNFEMHYRPNGAWPVLS